ncbi:hypothetical protein [Actinotalea sp. K2]|uniref:hypothetical protein n=1 Tax=Actinotalea sp. K2 TaxID=2939438 RepID=UPI002017B2E2|nr:hypothetical protein [Actinotalea sp. K2]MCL3860150.1 hypothetical protein [Actinotalea sp. K2]
MTHALPDGVPPVARIDHDLLAVYLNDHLAGASAGVARLRRTADGLSGTPVGPDLDRVAREVEGEREELRGLLADLGVSESRSKQVALWVGERIARLKANGRLTRSSPMTPLLEVELLRSAVMGKRGLWQTLADLSPALGLDGPRVTALLLQTDAQLDTLDQVHSVLRKRSLRERAQRPG